MNTLFLLNSLFIVASVSALSDTASQSRLLKAPREFGPTSKPGWKRENPAWIEKGGFRSHVANGAITGAMIGGASLGSTFPSENYGVESVGAVIGSVVGGSVGAGIGVAKKARRISRKAYQKARGIVSSSEKSSPSASSI